MAHDVFISHSSKDKAVADAVCATLEARGIRCWIAPRDIAPGESWPRAITHAVEASRVMVLVVSANANLSDQIGREVTLAATHGLTIVPLRVEAVTPNAELAYYLLRVHWLDAITPPLEQHLQELADRVTVNLAARSAAGSDTGGTARVADAEPARRELGEGEERERLARERAEADRFAEEQAARERAERDRQAQARLDQEQREQARLEQARLDRERAEQERRARERPEQDRLERERLEQERLEQERLAQERAEQERAEQERREREERERRTQKERRRPVWLSAPALALALAVPLLAVAAWLWLPGFLSGEIRSFRGHSNQLAAVAFSPDGRRILSGALDGSARLWDVDTGREIKRVTTTNVDSVAFLPDGTRFLTGGSLTMGGGNNSLELWNADTGNRIRAFELNSYVFGLAFSPDGRRAVSANGPRNTFNIWDLDREQPLRELTYSTLGTTFARAAAYSPDGSRLLLGDDHVRVVDPESGRELRRFGDAATGSAAAWAPDGRSVVTTGQAVVVWDAESGQELRRIPNTDRVSRVAFSPDGRRLLAGDTDGFVRLFDAQTGQELRRFKADQYQVTAVAFSPDGHRAVAAGWDETFRLWALPD